MLLKLGTRRSLLAKTQSLWVASQIKKKHPHLEIELIGIETRGDQITDIPLGQVQGKEFFVAELDEALKNKKVDFTVHSLKDLSLERPKEFVLAAIPKRENAKDILIYKPTTNSSVLSIGTSSPRRKVNLSSLLKDFFPQVSQFKMVDLRGNVNTRLKYLQEGRFDAIVLAVAGLLRLIENPNSQKEILPLLQNCRFRVLGLTEFPTAPGQGGLAVECLKENKKLMDILSSIHDQESEALINLERAFLKNQGGGCHQEFGATAFFHPECKTLFITKGQDLKGSPLNEIKQIPPHLISKSQETIIPWDSTKCRAQLFKEKSLELKPILLLLDLNNTIPLFVTHARAMTQELSKNLLSHNQTQKLRIFTSGTQSARELCRLGFWVEATAENLGAESFFKELFSHGLSQLLNLPRLPQKWWVLTHQGAAHYWKNKGFQVLTSYELQFLNPHLPELKKATHVFWGSGSAFDALKGEGSGVKVHACGAGQTAQHIRKAGIEPLIFLNRESWKQWIQKISH